jgi:outer membrane protein OmpA-like peptidoglycan-associated protein
MVDKKRYSCRLTAKGYGESQLVNDCGCEPTNQSNCTEEQHQANRRSEFIIVSMQ